MEFNKGGYESSFEFNDEEKKKPVRFSPVVIAKMHGRPLPPPERERPPAKKQWVFDSVLDRKIPKSKLASYQKKEKKMKDNSTIIPVADAGVPPAGIQSTTDYAIFKYLSINRPVDRAHVRKLADAIRRKNLLHLNPIVVNSDMEVMDGQHRLEAAKLLRTSIFYAQDTTISQDDIAGMNSNKKNWQLMDYINFFASKGQQSYIDFLAFCKKHQDIPATSLVSLCSGEGKRKTKDIQEGRLDMSNIAVAEKIITYLSEFKNVFPTATSSRFIEAVSFMVNTGHYDHSRMMGKIQNNPGLLVPCANQKQYIQLLQQIYNRGVHDRNVVLFLKR